jgi:hypothetical protein
MELQPLEELREEVPGTLVTLIQMATNGDTVPVGQGRWKIILKIDGKILGELFFQKIFFCMVKTRIFQE